VRLQRDENATPMVPSGSVVARCARTPRVTLSADVPLPLGVTEHDDQVWSRQAPEWAPMGVFHPNALAPLAGSEPRTRALSASAARFEELCRALALTDSREAGTTGRWVEPERRALEESCGAPA
jgi:hypothetical protein